MAAAAAGAAGVARGGGAAAVAARWWRGDLGWGGWDGVGVGGGGKRVG